MNFKLQDAMGGGGTSRNVFACFGRCCALLRLECEWSLGLGCGLEKSLVPYAVSKNARWASLVIFILHGSNGKSLHRATLVSSYQKLLMYYSGERGVDRQRR